MKIAEFVSTSEGFRDTGPVLDPVPDGPKVTGTINLNSAKVITGPDTTASQLRLQGVTS